MKMKKLVRGVKNRLLRLSDKPHEFLLFNGVSHQKETFFKLQNSFSQAAKKLSEASLGDFVEPHWKDLNKTFLNVIKNGIPFSFLRHPLIGYTMFAQGRGEWMNNQITFLKSIFSIDVLKKVLREDFAVMPLIMQHSFKTSHNSIHLLYHIARWQKTTNINIYDINTVIEWGGGYGRFAVLFDRLRGDKPYTYIIIDTPLFSSLQGLYLSVILGEEKVNFIDNEKGKIMDGKINIVPLNYVGVCGEVKADLFVSTWALSESSLFSQRFVIEKNMYEARHILMAYQEKNIRLPNAEGVKDIVQKFGCVIEDISFLPPNHYIFK